MKHKTPFYIFLLLAGLLATACTAANNPHFPQDAISITREEFETAYDELAEAGLPMNADINQAWLDFAGWRVNYDTVLLALARLVQAPYAPWSSDRTLIGQ